MHRLHGGLRRDSFPGCPVNLLFTHELDGNDSPLVKLFIETHLFVAQDQRDSASNGCTRLLALTFEANLDLSLRLPGLGTSHCKFG